MLQVFLCFDKYYFSKYFIYGCTIISKTYLIYSGSATLKEMPQYHAIAQHKINRKITTRHGVTLKHRQPNGSQCIIYICSGIEIRSSLLISSFWNRDFILFWFSQWRKTCWWDLQPLRLIVCWFKIIYFYIFYIFGFHSGEKPAGGTYSLSLLIPVKFYGGLQLHTF